MAVFLCLDFHKTKHKSFLQIREKEKKTREDQDPAISQAKRRKQMIASLPKLFDMVHYFFQSIKRSAITKDELMHKIIASHLDIVDKSRSRLLPIKQDRKSAIL